MILQVYCIIPVIHRPTFMADLAAHEEERKPMLLAMILATLALTLLHVSGSRLRSQPVPTSLLLD